MAAGAHDILLQAECILTSIPPFGPWAGQSKMKTDVRSNQPKDAQQGLQQVKIPVSIVCQCLGNLQYLNCSMGLCLIVRLKL